MIEWLAYYQYWLGAKTVKGPMKEAVIAELLQHATDELRHADMVAGRIIQLGGTPVTERKKWYDVTSCGYEAPDDHSSRPYSSKHQGERCAIGFYKKLLEATQGKDPVTYNMVWQILQDEVAHEEDLQSLAEDLEMMLKR